MLLVFCRVSNLLPVGISIVVVTGGAKFNFRSGKITCQPNFLLNNLFCRDTLQHLLASMPDDHRAECCLGERHRYYLGIIVAVQWITIKKRGRKWRANGGWF